MISSLEAEKSFDKVQPPLHDKCSGEIRDTRDILQYNIGSLQQAHIQHQTKGTETENNSSIITNKERLSTL